MTDDVTMGGGGGEKDLGPKNGWRGGSTNLARTSSLLPGLVSGCAVSMRCTTSFLKHDQHHCVVAAVVQTTRIDRPWQEGKAHRARWLQSL